MTPNYNFSNVSLADTSLASLTVSDVYDEDRAGQISLKGKNADILVNDVSLMSVLERIEQRLGILRPNPELESRYEELRRLSEQYKQLEQELLHKEKMWDILKGYTP